MKLVNQDTLKFSQRIYAVSHHSLLLYIVVRGGGEALAWWQALAWRVGQAWRGRRAAIRAGNSVYNC